MIMSTMLRITSDIIQSQIALKRKEGSTLLLLYVVGKILKSQKGFLCFINLTIN